MLRLLFGPDGRRLSSAAAAGHCEGSGESPAPAGGAQPAARL